MGSAPDSTVNGTAPRTSGGSAAQQSMKNMGCILAIIVVWIIADIASKSYFNSGQFSIGQHIAGPFMGIFRFTLVHNTGAAWGMLGDSTFLLGCFSVFVCALVLIYVMRRANTLNLWQIIGFGLVVAGGLGNAIDRFFQGYVVDFIEFTFIDFPVFNVADIGVTVGFAFLIFGFYKEIKAEATKITMADLEKQRQELLAQQEAAGIATADNTGAGEAQDVAAVQTQADVSSAHEQAPAKRGLGIFGKKAAKDQSSCESEAPEDEEDDDEWWDEDAPDHVVATSMADGSALEDVVDSSSTPKD